MQLVMHSDLLLFQKFIRSIFLYLDRKYVLQTKGVASIWDMGVAFYGDIVIGDDGIRSRLVAAMLSTIESERYEGRQLG